MTLIRFTDPNGEPVWINPDHIATVRARHDAPGVDIGLAVAYRDGSDDADLFGVYVEEELALVVGLLGGDMP